MSGCKTVTNHPNINNSDIEKPSWEKSTPKPTEEIILPDGYASRLQYIIINDNDVIATVYYNVSTREFRGLIQNKTEATVEGISIEIKRLDGEILGMTEPIELLSGDSDEFSSIYERNIFEGWTVDLLLQRDSNENLKESTIEIKNRLDNGNVVNFDWKKNKFHILTNKGTMYNGEIFAGLNQTIVMTENKISATIYYDEGNNSFIAKLKNYSEDNTVNFNITIEFENNRFSNTTREIILTPGESAIHGIEVYGNMNYMIWRPYFFFNKGKLEDASKSFEVVGKP